MPLLTLGINHNTAPVDVRENVVIPASRLSDALMNLQSSDNVEAGVIISTCNRTELYCETSNGEPDSLTNWLAGFQGLNPDSISKHTYHFTQEETVRHILRVASGLDSMILGEPQILGQLKSAYQAAKDAGSLGIYLDRLFQHTFSVAKQVRSETSIGSSPVSVAYAAVTLAKQIFSELEGQTALLVGAGETIELVARHLHNNGIGRMIVANRSYERAHHLAKQFDAFAIELTEIDSHLAEADVVISSTASEEPIVKYDHAEAAVKKRRRRPILMVDIAVPRDIEPKIAELEDIYLYTVDDLEDIIKENLKSRQSAAEEAEDIINEHVSHFMGWMNIRDVVPTICQVRDHANDLKEEVLNKARRQLARGISADEVMEQLARNLTNKLIHQPCTRLREAGFHQEEEVVESARKLFGVDENTTS
ncbi:MAG: glutamyl-tRNA reductase [Gammaproteobacteria bacterium]|nr:MAG: glutamyl-tRNA reductase [Gammaproteobacteria bacterium]